ncbi:MAG: hypothetical protein ACI4RV_06560, partial [Eubacteriales bacterium]
SGTSLALRAENSQGNFRSESFDIITLAEVPVTSGDAGIRVDSDPAKTGIRFRADVAPRLREIATEYGFIVARKSILNLIGKTETDLTFDLTSADANCKLFVSGAAFTTDADGNITKDQSYRIDNETGTITYTGVCVGISKENYAESLVARPYAKIAVNGVSVTLYGSAVSTSMVDVAKAVQNAGGTYYEKHKDAIDGIVAG